MKAISDIGCCTRCGRELDPNATVWLELDQRTNTYHDFGDVPEARSQGWFEFGVDCANRERTKAFAALAKARGKA